VAFVGEWRRYFRVAHRVHTFEARRAQEGETYGYKGLRKAKAGQWLCREPTTGHTWVCSDDDFRAMYCEVGKSVPPPKPKRQSAGTKKLRGRSLSLEVQDSTIPGGLFGGEGDGGKKGADVV
jgi:hypothetical protein